MGGNVSVTVDFADLLRMLAQPEAVLRELDVACLGEVRHTLDLANFIVPRGGAPDDPLNLADTGFVLGPVLNLGPPLSTTWFSGFSHPAAGAIHAGWHFGRQTRAAPDFMRKAFRGARGRARKAVAAQLGHALSKFLPPK